jgi:hypothetical protein
MNRLLIALTVGLFAVTTAQADDKDLTQVIEQYKQEHVLHNYPGVFKRTYIETKVFEPTEHNGRMMTPVQFIYFEENTGYHVTSKNTWGIYFFQDDFKVWKYVPTQVQVERQN